MITDTKKYDGSLHYRFPVTVVTSSPTTLALYRHPKTEMESYRGRVRSDTHLLEIFFADRHHNVLFMWEEDWKPKLLYVNVATPATWDGVSVTAIDMDLDLLKWPGKPDIVLDDEDEFREHSKLYGYPEDLVAICETEVETLRDLIARGEGVFAERGFEWRPGEPLWFAI